MAALLQFGERLPDRDYAFRATAFGVVLKGGLLACARVERGENSYLDLPGGAIDAGETEAEALAREFVEETGLTIRVGERLMEAAQFVLKSDGRTVNNTGGFWTGEVVSHDPAAKREEDHQLLWVDPFEAVKTLRHEAHAWAVALMLRRRVVGTRASPRD